jgi:rod shape-determining protein MreC
MRSLLNLILKYYFTILFVLIEIISLSLVFQNNRYQKAALRNGVDAFSAAIDKRVNVVNKYLNLRHINNQLVQENVILRNRLDENFVQSSDTFKILSDTIRDRKYKFLKARVVNNSVNKQFNYITINKGRLDNIKPEMAVMSSEGIVGIVQGVSDHFATVIPIINKDFRVSVKILKNDYFGSLLWPGISYRKAELREIPYHVDIAIGDMVVTSGYSSIFPEGIPIGNISDYNVKEGNFYIIEIDLAADFKKLSYVYVIENMLKEEKIELENIIEND